MKKILLSLLLFSGLSIQAQELRHEDALRYGMQDLTGTARFRAMSGAFGAVGGDLSAISVNPAGSVFFNNNYFTVTASNYNTKNKSNYFSTTTKENNSTLDLNQAGAVFIFKNQNTENDWKKFSIAINYENTNDFDNALFIQGTNLNNSIGNYFVNNANGIASNELSAFQYSDFGFAGQQAFLGYQTYIIDPTSANTYASNVPAGGNYMQKNYIETTGYNGKVAFNFATSYRDILFLGVNLNAHFSDYRRTTSLLEENSNTANTTGSSIRRILFKNEVYTYGNGFSMNVGAIAKVTPEFRIGVAYESPTWHKLNDELTQGIETTSENNPNGISNPYNYPNVTNIYPEYKLQTPSKLTGSATYIFGKKGLLSADVAVKDYSNTTFRPKNEEIYEAINSYMTNQLTNTLELRLGGEYRYKQWAFRAGYRFEESPYKTDYALGDLTGYSGGIGYSFGKSKLDITYATTYRKYNQYLLSSGMNDMARIEQKQNNITLSYSVNF